MQVAMLTADALKASLTALQVDFMEIASLIPHTTFVMELQIALMVQMKLDVNL